MKILVTGGAGFIGGNFVHFQLKHHPEDQIICLDALTYAGNMETLKDAISNPNFTFVQGSIADRDAVYALFEQEKPDVVVNMEEKLMDLKMKYHISLFFYFQLCLLPYNTIVWH